MKLFHLFIHLRMIKTQARHNVGETKLNIQKKYIFINLRMIKIQARHNGRATDLKNLYKIK